MTTKRADVSDMLTNLTARLDLVDSLAKLSTASPSYLIMGNNGVMQV